jgi:2-oxo-4-hydroxy-4-carboxy-5-ureidoimidazoline decarboxylase
VTLDALNNMDQATFTGTIGWVFEHSPWIAKQAWNKRPFSSLANLHLTMMNIVEESSIEEKLDILRKHPDLAARVQMADASVREQAGVGLDRLSHEEYEEFLTLNRTYTLKYSFPFIMAVRGQSKDRIRSAIQKRIRNTYNEELEEALCQVYKIAHFRLEDIFKDV